jgi:outer membrane protein OmpA-like peptidoglycan-associated protein
MDLSERRANSTIQYIISKGISADRISGKVLENLS